jgi:hypothetical protein
MVQGGGKRRAEGMSTAAIAGLAHRGRGMGDRGATRVNRNKAVTRGTPDPARVLWSRESVGRPRLVLIGMAPYGPLHHRGDDMGDGEQRAGSAGRQCSAGLQACA